MGVKQPREMRRIVALPARMRTDEGWKNIQVHDVSTGGLMAIDDHPPPAGSCVEVRCESQIIAGRVAWSTGTRFGIETAEPIDVQALIDGRLGPRLPLGRPGAPPAALSPARGRDHVEPRRASVERQDQSVGGGSSAGQYAMLAVTGLAAVVLVVETIRQSL